MKIEVALTSLGEALTLKALMRKQSLRDIAKECGVSIATLSRVAHGKTTSLKSTVAIAKWLELTPLEFWELVKGEMI